MLWLEGCSSTDSLDAPEDSMFDLNVVDHVRLNLTRTGEITWFTRAPRARLARHDGVDAGSGVLTTCWSPRRGPRS